MREEWTSKTAARIRQEDADDRGITRPQAIGIALGAATVYYMASRKLRVLVSRPLRSHIWSLGLTVDLRDLLRTDAVADVSHCPFCDGLLNDCVPSRKSI